jgi:hypothetical protein
MAGGTWNVPANPKITTTGRVVLVCHLALFPTSGIALCTILREADRLRLALPGVPVSPWKVTFPVGPAVAASGESPVNFKV